MSVTALQVHGHPVHNRSRLYFGIYKVGYCEITELKYVSDPE